MQHKHENLLIPSTRTNPKTDLLHMQLLHMQLQLAWDGPEGESLPDGQGRAVSGMYRTVKIKQSTWDPLLTSQCVRHTCAHTLHTHTRENTTAHLSHLYSFSSTLINSKIGKKSTLHACNGQAPLALPLSTVFPLLSYLCHPWPFLPVLVHLTKIWKPPSKSYKDFLKHMLGVQTPQKLQCSPPQTQK